MPECYEPPPAVAAIERADSRKWHLPVAAVLNNTVLSFYGDPRDGGSRRHAGIDIGASRGTPVHAPVDARVITSRNGGRGGHTVVLLDTNGNIQFVYHASGLARRARRAGRAEWSADRHSR